MSSHIHANLTSGKWEEIPGIIDEVGPFSCYCHGNTSLGASCPPALPALLQPQPHPHWQNVPAQFVLFSSIPARMAVQGEAGGRHRVCSHGEQRQEQGCFPCLHACGATAWSLWSHRLQQASSKFQFQRVWKPLCFLKKLVPEKKSWAWVLIWKCLQDANIWK